jgi:pSer/pThr/pTyr-binding forkhead associated (FHA) protein
MVYPLGERDVIDTPSLGMLTNNRIKGVAPVLFTQQDENRYLKYNVSAKVPVGKFLAGGVTKKRMLGVLESAAAAMLEADEYMLAADRFVLDRDYIFADLTTFEASFIYLPLKSEESRAPDLAAFFKELVFGAQYDQSENSDYVAKIISFLNGAELFSLGDFAALIRKLSGGAEARPAGVSGAVTHIEEAPRYTAPPQLREAQYTAPPAPEPRPPLSTPTPSEPTARPTPTAPKSSPPPQSPPVPPRRAPVNAAANNAADSSAPAGGADKKISLFQLLMHYSKENKEAYRAQKSAKAKPGAIAESAARPRTAAAREGSAGFAVPGAAEPAKQPPERVSQSTVQAYQPAPRPDSAAVRGGNFGETVVLGGGTGGPTTNLSGEGGGGTEGEPYLIRVRNNEKIILSRPVFRIGKERSFADYFIGDNTAVSRGHAEFLSREGEYFVSDMNSTNHTYVNGEMLRDGAEARLSHGDKVRLADEEFEFRLY